ncbi:hypothetical protein [Neomicrococcus lactis]
MAATTPTNTSIPAKFGWKFTAGIAFSVVNQAWMRPGKWTALVVA